MKCQRCWGTGQEPDNSLRGEMANRLRKQRGLGQTETARKMGISGAYLCRLESGKRPWSMELWQKFQTAAS